MTTVTFRLWMLDEWRDGRFLTLTTRKGKKMHLKDWNQSFKLFFYSSLIRCIIHLSIHIEYKKYISVTASILNRQLYFPSAFRSPSATSNFVLLRLFDLCFHFFSVPHHFFFATSEDFRVSLYSETNAQTSVGNRERISPTIQPPVSNDLISIDEINLCLIPSSYLFFLFYIHLLNYVILVFILVIQYHSLLFYFPFLY